METFIEHSSAIISVDFYPLNIAFLFKQNIHFVVVAIGRNWRYKFLSRVSRTFTSSALARKRKRSTVRMGPFLCYLARPVGENHFYRTAVCSRAATSVPISSPSLVEALGFPHPNADLSEFIG